MKENEKREMHVGPRGHDRNRRPWLAALVVAALVASTGLLSSSAQVPDPDPQQVWEGTQEAVGNAWEEVLPTQGICVAWSDNPDDPAYSFEVCADPNKPYIPYQEYPPIEVPDPCNQNGVYGARVRVLAGGFYPSIATQQNEVVLFTGDVEAGEVVLDSDSAILVAGNVLVHDLIDMDQGSLLGTLNGMDVARVHYYQSPVPPLDFEALHGGDITLENGLLRMDRATIAAGDGMKPLPRYDPDAMPTMAGLPGTTGGNVNIGTPDPSFLQVSDGCVATGKGGEGGAPCTPHPMMAPTGSGIYLEGGDGGEGGGFNLGFTDPFTPPMKGDVLAEWHNFVVHLGGGGHGYDMIADAQGFGGITARGGLGGDSGWISIESAAPGMEPATMGDVQSVVFGGVGGDGGDADIRRELGLMLWEPADASCQPPEVTGDPPVTGTMVEILGNQVQLYDPWTLVDWLFGSVTTTLNYVSGSGSDPVRGADGSAEEDSACTDGQRGEEGEAATEPGAPGQLIGPLEPYPGALWYYYVPGGNGSDAQRGGDGLTPQHPARATGGDGGDGFLWGGNGGEAVARACSGGDGGQGGRGSNGGDAPNVTPPRHCETYTHTWGNITVKGKEHTSFTKVGNHEQDEYEGGWKTRIAEEEKETGQPMTPERAGELATEVWGTFRGTNATDTERGGSTTLLNQTTTYDGYTHEYQVCSDSVLYHTDGGKPGAGGAGGNGGNGQHATANAGDGGHGLITGGNGGNALAEAGHKGWGWIRGANGRVGMGCHERHTTNQPSGADGTNGNPTANAGEGGRSILPDSLLNDELFEGIQDGQDGIATEDVPEKSVKDPKKPQDVGGVTIEPGPQDPADPEDQCVVVEAAKATGGKTAYKGLSPEQLQATTA